MYFFIRQDIVTDFPSYFDVDRALHLAQGKPYDLEIVPITGSTNDDLKQYARTHVHERVKIRLAFQQTVGRGVHGRPWESESPSLLFSMLTYYPLNYPYFWLPIAMGLSVAEILRNASFDALLKWPNDIFIDGGKAGGILCEQSRNPEGVPVLVAGVGLNLVKQEGTTTHGWPRSGLYKSKDELDPTTITDYFMAIINHMVASLDLQRHTLYNRWMGYDAFFGEDIYVDIGDRIIQGNCAGIDDRAHLVLETPWGRRTFASASIVAPQIARYRWI